LILARKRQVLILIRVWYRIVFGVAFDQNFIETLRGIDDNTFLRRVE